MSALILADEHYVPTDVNLMPLASRNYQHSGVVSPSLKNSNDTVLVPLVICIQTEVSVCVRTEAKKRRPRREDALMRTNESGDVVVRNVLALVFIQVGGKSTGHL